MSILDQLFGTQSQPDTGGLVQNILSQRFQPSLEDVNQSAFMTGVGRFQNPSEAMQQRIQPAMGVASTLGQLNMSQIALQRLQEEQLKDQIMWKMEFGKLPQTGGPMPTFGQQNNPPVGFQNNQPQQNTISMGMSNLTPEQQKDDLSQLYPESVPGGMASPQGGEVPLTSSQGKTEYTPIKTGFGVPFPVEGSPGQMWAADKNGNMVAQQIPGTPPKMEAGVAVTTDPRTGKPQQQVPENPQAKAKFEDALQRIAILTNQLREEGGTVEQGGNILNNSLNTVASSNFSLPIPMAEGERIDLPGGQTVARMAGSKSAGVRDEIQSLVNQELLPYMQAVGATPGMERAYQAQMNMLKSLGGQTYLQRDTILDNLASLSSQAGTGQLAVMRNPKLYDPNQRQQQLQQAINPQKQAAGNQAGQIQEGTTAINPANGHKIRVANGIWVDAKTGVPIQ